MVLAPAQTPVHTLARASAGQIWLDVKPDAQTCLAKHSCTCADQSINKAAFTQS